MQNFSNLWLMAKLQHRIGTVSRKGGRLLTQQQEMASFRKSAGQSPTIC